MISPTTLPSAPPQPGGLAPHVRPFCVPVRDPDDILAARQQGRVLALELGFSGPDVTRIAAAISEVARNIVEHAGSGDVIFSETHVAGRTGLTIRARDNGPGMIDAEGAADYGGALRESAIVGLPGVRVLMDEFSIDSSPGRGTTVIMTKWR